MTRGASGFYVSSAVEGGSYVLWLLVDGWQETIYEVENFLREKEGDSEGKRVRTQLAW